ncbi:LuxR C-terminal-related transcriptional regulator [Paraburkholderia sp. BR14320]|uniref:LuxR C-terminal-related transcriptional regulator n=1 Tax=unclassified Paraburkholderia TaxID=2615204 RepID=UPI0034CD8B53
MNDAAKICSEQEIRILLVSLVRLLREGLATILAQHPAFHDVCAVADADAALAALGRFHPTLVLLDIAGEDGLVAGRRIASAAPSLHILGFAARAREHDVLAYARSGVSGFVSCDASNEDLVDAIGRAARGELLCPPKVAGILFRHLATQTRIADAHPRHAPLTDRERQIVHCIDQGYSNKEIARHLGIELSTVKNHVHSILDKLQVARRGEAAARMRVADHAQVMFPSQDS